MPNRAVSNYKNSHPLVITLQVSLYPDRILGERIKKWRLEQGLFQKDLAKMIGVDEMTIVNWEKYRTRQEAWGSVFEYIEIFYNRIRKHSSWNYCSPAEFEKRASEA